MMGVEEATKEHGPTDEKEQERTVLLPFLDLIRDQLLSMTCSERKRLELKRPKETEEIEEISSTPLPASRLLSTTHRWRVFIERYIDSVGGTLMSVNSQVAEIIRASGFDRLITKTHIGLYRRTNGAIGWHIAGRSLLLLMTIGRKSGQERTHPVQYMKDGREYIVIGSYGGAPHDPQWARNLQANPQVKIQVGPDVIDATARKANSQERARIWLLVTRRFKDYASYQANTAREMPVFLLTPKSTSSPS